MKPSRVRVNVFLACMALVFSAACAAQDSRVSIGASIGYRAGGEFTDETTGRKVELDEGQSYGLTVDIWQTPQTDLELLWSRQNSRLTAGAAVSVPLFDVTIDYYQIGGTYLLRQPGYQPFFGATLGAVHFSPGAGVDSATRFAFSLAGGVKIPVGQHFGLRFEARAYGTVLNGDSAILCSGGSCLIHAQGDLLWQYEANAGVYLSF